MDRVIVLCSGGLNSAVIAALAGQEHQVALLHARLGLRTSEREFQAFEAMAGRFEAADRLVIDLPHFAAIGGNARVDPGREFEPVSAATDGVSASYIPGLVSGLLSAAFTWAQAIGATRVCIGVSEHLGPPGPRTSAVWPDYSRECLHFWNSLFDSMSPRRPVCVETPLIDMKRGETIQLGRHLSVPFEATWTCLASGEEPCGACLGCVTRTRGFLDTGLPDPLLAETVAAA